MKKILLWLVIMIVSMSMLATFSLSGCKEEATPAEEEVAEEEVAEEEVAEERNGRRRNGIGCKTTRRKSKINCKYLALV